MGKVAQLPNEKRASSPPSPLLHHMEEREKPRGLDAALLKFHQSSVSL